MSPCVRQRGAGRRDAFKGLKELLKKWVENETISGHGVRRADLVKKFDDMLSRAVDYGEEVELKGKLSAEGEARLAVYRHRMVNLEKPTYRKWFGKDLLKECDVKPVKPQQQWNPPAECDVPSSGGTVGEGHDIEALLGQMLSRDFEEMDDEVEVNKWMEVDPDLKASQLVGPNIKVWLALDGQ